VNVELNTSRSSENRRWVMKGAVSCALKAGTGLAKAGYEIVRLRSTITNAALAPVTSARRRLRKGAYAIEDVADKIALTIRRQPVKSISITFGIAFGLGLALGWVGKRT
jgi:hypothetical protein